MATTLRQYQADAVNAVYDYLRNQAGNPCVVIPTGGGKTICLKQITEDAVDKWGGRVLLLAHVKELLEQAAEKLQRPDVGIYSAGLGSRDKRQPIIIAGIQSVYNRAAELGAFNLILIDECHLLPPDGEGMYQTFLKDALLVNPKLRLVGFTATPYRMSTGLICGPENLLNEICYEASIPDLIVQGYLSPVRSKQSRREVDLSSARIRGGEFHADDIANLMDDDDVVERAVEEIRAYTRDRTSVLIFASSVRHAMHLESLIDGAETITGDTPSAARADRIERFRKRELKFLINVNVLSTGFDAPNVDAICLLRPTLSPGLYYQQVGRGLRLCESKQDCLVLDFAGNVKRHGPIDQIKPPRRRSKSGPREETEAAPNTKTCPACQEIVNTGFEVCPACGYQWPAKHTAVADETPVLSIPEPPETHVVRGVGYAVHYKKDAQPDAPRTLRVDYQIGLGERVSEWVCIEHDGFAGEKARAWWRARCHDPFPEDADLAVAIANAGGLAETLEITTKKDGKWHRVVSARVSEKPVPTLLTSADLEADDF